MRIVVLGRLSIDRIRLKQLCFRIHLLHFCLSKTVKRESHSVLCKAGTFGCIELNLGESTIFGKQVSWEVWHSHFVVELVLFQGNYFAFLWLPRDMHVVCVRITVSQQLKDENFLISCCQFGLFMHKTHDVHVAWDFGKRYDCGLCCRELFLCQPGAPVGVFPVFSSKKWFLLCFGCLL